MVWDMSYGHPEIIEKQEALLLRVTSAWTHVGSRYAGEIDEE